jgi:hypothetical protein
VKGAVFHPKNAAYTTAQEKRFLKDNGKLCPKLS